jgi:hypothetical protein
MVDNSRQLSSCTCHWGNIQSLIFDESNNLLPAIKEFGDVTVNKVTDHTITYNTLKDQQAQFVPDKTTTMSTFKLQNRIEDTGLGITGMVVCHW